MGMIRRRLSQMKYDYYKRKAIKKFSMENKHNNLVLLSRVPDGCVVAGKKSYGPLSISYGSPDLYHLVIGSYCSIAPGVIFLLANEHDLNTVSSFPIEQSVLGLGPKALGKGDIVLGDDVWIGQNALICSGVKIGQGACIAAGAVVSKDVPPYAIVGGNPARVLKYRFSEDVIKKLVSVDVCKLFDSFTAEDTSFISDKDLTVQKIDDFMKRKNI